MELNERKKKKKKNESSRMENASSVIYLYARPNSTNFVCDSLSVDENTVGGRVINRVRPSFVYIFI